MLEYLLGHELSLPGTQPFVLCCRTLDGTCDMFVSIYGKSLMAGRYEMRGAAPVQLIAISERDRYNNTYYYQVLGENGVAYRACILFGNTTFTPLPYYNLEIFRVHALVHKRLR